MVAGIPGMGIGGAERTAPGAQTYPPGMGSFLTQKEFDEKAAELAAKRKIDLDQAKGTLRTIIPFFDSAAEGATNPRTKRLRDGVAGLVDSMRGQQREVAIEDINKKYGINGLDDFQDWNKRFNGGKPVDPDAIERYLKVAIAKKEPADQKGEADHAKVKAAYAELVAAEKEHLAKDKQMKVALMDEMLGLRREGEEPLFDMSQVQANMKKTLEGAMQGFPFNMPSIGGILQSLVSSLLSAFKPLNDTRAQATTWAMGGFKDWDGAGKNLRQAEVLNDVVATLGLKPEEAGQAVGVLQREASRLSADQPTRTALAGGSSLGGFSPGATPPGAARPAVGMGIGATGA